MKKLFGKKDHSRKESSFFDSKEEKKFFKKAWCSLKSVSYIKLEPAFL